MATPKRLHIDAMTSLTPARVSEPGQSRRICVAAPLSNEALQNHVRIVLYYKRPTDEKEEDSAPLLLGAGIKESMGPILSAHPVMAGRLRRDREGDGYWEIKYNDSGVRLVQASAETTMSEFLDSKERSGGEDLLAYWVDVDRDNPEFSPLFYIQVTGFQGDGYSIGISCSLLLADPVFITQFLKKWAASHSQMIAEGRFSKSSIFHLDYFKRPGKATHLKSIPLPTSPTNNNPAATMIRTILFKVPRPPGGRQLAPSHLHALASRCLEEATRRLEAMDVSEFTLITSHPSGELKVESCQKKQGQSDGVFDGELSLAWWDELGIEELALVEANKPVDVSSRIVICGRRGLVVAMLPSHDDKSSSELMIVSTTVPPKA